MEAARMSSLTPATMDEICSQARKLSGAIIVMMVFPDDDGHGAHVSMAYPRGSGAEVAKLLRETAAEYEMKSRPVVEIKQPPQPGAAAT